MSQSEKSKSPTSRRAAKKAQAQELETRVADMVRARDAAQKQAIEAHTEFQNLSRRAGELESQIGELDAELKRARDEAAQAKSRVPELENRIRDLSEQVLRAGGLEESLAEARRQLEKAAAARDQASREVEASRAKVDELQRDLPKHKAELSNLQEQVRNLEFEKGRLRVQTVDREGELRRVREEAARANARVAELDRRCREAETQASRASSMEREAAAGRQAADAARAAGRELEDSRRRLEEAQREIAQLKSDLAKRDEQRGAAEKDASQLKTQVAGMTQQLQATEARAAESSRYFDSLERELIESREAEAKALAEGARAADLEQTVKRLEAEIARLEGTRQEQQGWLDELGQSVVDLERRLEEALAAPRVPASLPESPAGEPALKEPEAPVDQSAPEPLVGPPPEAPPPPPQSSLPEPPTQADVTPAVETGPSPQALVPPPPEAAPSAASRSSETVLRPQNLFGPPAADGQPAYVLLEIQGRDPLGAVYRARERFGERLFSVRFMGGQAGEEQTLAIEREVEKLIALPHPNILHVQGSGRRKNRLYLATDLIEAPTLGHSSIREIPRLCAIFRDVAAAVHYAHEEGVFHGDLNPENILVGVDGGGDHALVKDFGLGYLMETVVPPSTGGTASEPIRNPAFLPPEQVRVLKSPLGAAVDVYGLGATIYASLAGRPPFEGKDVAQVLKRVMIEEPVPVERLRPEIPPSLGAVVRRAMAKERGLRYASLQEVVEGLNRILEASSAGNV